MAQGYSRSDVFLGDSAQLDAFGRLRTSNVFSVFESENIYDKQPLFWNEDTTGTASATHQSNEASVELSVDTAENDRVVRQTKEYFRYQAGKSQLVKITTLFGEAKAGVTRLAGYGDDDNGLFFGQDSAGLYVMTRTKTSGSVVDTKVYQTAWNIDRFDGSENSLNPSCVNLDITKAQHFVIDFQWLGVGRIRFGLYFNGEIKYGHKIDAANSLDVVYMATPNLPIRYELKNTAATASASTLKEICCSIISEGGIDEPGATPFSVSKTAASITITSSIPLAIRHKSTFNSIINRAQLISKIFTCVATTNNILLELLYDPTLTGSPTWTSTDANSTIEYSTDISTDFSNGIVIASIVASAAQGSKSGDVTKRGITDRLPIGLDIDGANAIVLGLRATSIGGSATADLTFDWTEIV